MALDGISYQNITLRLPPVASHPTPPPAAAQEELGVDAKTELHDRDVASFSSDAQELAASSQRKIVGTTQLEATSKQGTAVNVTVNPTPPVANTPATQEENVPDPTAASYSVSLTRQNGSQLNIDFGENVRIHEAKDGTTSVYFSDTNKTRTYGLDGAIEEIEGDTVAPNADAILINTSGKVVQGGNGDNLIFNFANDTEIYGGSGNDTIILADDIFGNSIDTGSGNDTVKGRLLTDTTINLGEGNNIVDISGMSGSSVSGGNGDNIVTFDFMGKARNEAPFDSKGKMVDGRVSNSSITLGDGNNTVNYFNGENNTVVIGNGDNKFYKGSLVANSIVTIGNGDNDISISNIYDNGSLNIGDGNNNVSVGTVGTMYKLFIEPNVRAYRGEYTGDPAQLNIGNGNNNIKFEGTQGNGEVNVGDGNNVISFSSVEHNSKVEIGNGHNAISGYSIGANAVMDIGNGNNTVQMFRTQDNGSLSMGNGNNSAKIAYIYNDSTVSAGNGNNAIRIDTIHNNGHVQVGDGNNDMGIDNMQDTASLKTGDGDNLVKMNTMRDSSLTSFGKGNNLATLNTQLDDSKFSGNGSLYIFSQFKDDVADISRQFLERKQQRVENGLPTTGFTMSLNAYMSGYRHGFTPPDNTPPAPGAPGVDINFSWGDQYGHWGAKPIIKYV